MESSYLKIGDKDFIFGVCWGQKWERIKWAEYRPRPLRGLLASHEEILAQSTSLSTSLRLGTKINALLIAKVLITKHPLLHHLVPE